KRSDSRCDLRVLDVSCCERLANRNCSCLLLIQLPTRVQIVKIQNRVEYQEVAPLSLASPDRVDRVGDHVPSADRHVDHGRVLRDLGAAIQKSGYQQVASIAVAQDDPRPILRGNDADPVATLLIGYGNRLPYFSARLIGYFGNCSSLRRIRIISSPATRHAVAIFSRRSTAASSTNCIPDIEDWSVVGISRKSLAVTVSNRARRVDKLCSQYAADGLQSLSRLN